jgi:hypothetical protein
MFCVGRPFFATSFPMGPCHSMDLPDLLRPAGGAKHYELPADAFQGKETDWSLPFNQVKGTSATSPFYSPSAKNRNTPGADLAVLRDAKALGDYKHVESAWLGKIFDSKHDFAYEHTLPSGEKQWIYPLHHFPDSAVLAIPLKLHSVPVSNLHYFEVDSPSEPILLGMFNISKYTRACMVVAHSPYWHAVYSNLAIKALPSAIRLFKSGNFKPLYQLAAENAFWLMPRNDVADFSAYWGHPVVGASNLFDTLLQAIQGLLGCSVDEALDFVHLRIAAMHSLTRYSKELTFR